MDSFVADQHLAMDESEAPAVIKKLKRLSNGTNEQEASEQPATEVKSPSSSLLENGAVCNGARELEEHGSESEDVKSTSSVLSGSARESTGEIDVTNGSNLLHSDLTENICESAKENDAQNVCDSRTGKNCDSVCGSEDSQGTDNKCERENQDVGALNNDKSGLDMEEEEETSALCRVDRVEGATPDDDHEEMDTDRICVIASVTGDVSVEDVTFEEEEEKIDKHVSEMEQDATEYGDVNRRRSKRTSERETRNRLNKERETSEAESVNRNKEVFDQWGARNLCKKEIEDEESQHDSKDSKHVQHSNNKNKEAADSEKENIDKNDTKVLIATKATEGKCQKRQSTEGKQAEKQNKYLDGAGDDIEIIGESKRLHKKTPNSKAHSSQKAAFVSSSLPGPHGVLGGAATSSTSLVASSPMMHGLTTGMPVMPSGFSFPGGVHGQGSSNLPLMVPTVAPPKPKSSLDQIELIRWEIQNRINTRPKYFKPNSSSELGPLAKFLFDIGSDLIKESVYHELVKIQSKKKGDDKLSTKEKEDLEKLKEIEKDLYATIGHLKLKLKRKCKVCNFHTESHNVMFYHKQYPHEDNKFLRCAHCIFSTKQAVSFKFHMEAEHAMQPKLHDKKAFYECDLCPYENNQEQKLILHKQRCLKQFRPLFNLHPSCLSGAEINLCLENIFYRPVIPKNLKFLQQKHAQQQAALAEARRQQAQMQVLAAQKNAAAVAARKQQQQIQKHKPVPTPASRAKTPQAARLPAAPKLAAATPQAQPRFNAPPITKGPSPAAPTVASMLNAKQNIIVPPPGAAGTTTASGFEVCEICGGYVKDRKALRIHFFYAHRIDLPFNLFERNQAPLYCATCYVRFWTAHGLRKHIDTHKEENQTRGVVGKCISCGHHVLNLLLHMRVVHNREMQHYINALMCMFCGSHFGSHQDCERHIVKAHGHIDPTTGTLKSAPNAPPAQQQQPPPQKAPPNNKKATNNNLVKGSVCVLCNLNFGRNVDLTRHCMRMHHTCMKCGMVVIDKASLMKHTCLSSPSGTRDCTMCGEPGFHPAYYVKHLRDKHLKRFSIRVRKLDKSTIEQWIKRPCPFNEQEVLVEISDSDEDAHRDKLITQSVATPAKKPRIGPASKIGRPCEVRKKSTAPPCVDIVVNNDDDVSTEEKKVVAKEEQDVAGNEDKALVEDKYIAGNEDKDIAEDKYIAGNEDKDIAGNEDKDIAGNEDKDIAGNEDKDIAGNEDKDFTEDKDIAGNEDKDIAGIKDKNDADDTSESAKEAVATPENTSVVDDSLSRGSSPGQKRKSVAESPESDEGSKRKK